MPNGADDRHAMFTGLLRPGDLLLYDDSGFIGWLIRTKTWSKVNHVELYIGDGKVIAARANGSHIFDLDTKEPYAVRRPVGPFDVNAGMDWFRSKAEGQKYDLFGLFRFFTLGKQSQDKQFCSELATRWYRAAGLEPFAPETDADLVPPGWFLTATDHFSTVYRKEGK